MKFGTQTIRVIALIWLLPLSNFGAGLAVSTVTLEKIPVQLVSLNGAAKIDLEITINKIVSNTNSLERKFAWENVVKLGTRENVLVMLYVQNRCLHYLEGGDLPPSITIRCKAGDEALKSARALKQKWFFFTTGAEFCKQTLAVRENGKVTSLTGASNETCDWIGFTQDTYEDWWNALEQNWELTRLLGSGTASQSK